MEVKKIKGIKKEMTQVFEEDGTAVPVTQVLVEEGLADLTEGSDVVVTGKAKGKGFAGVVKRWKFAGGPATHGSGWERKGGSIGGTTDPGRVFKGKKMAGRMGGNTVTVKGLRVVEIDQESRIAKISGAIPGHKGANVYLKVEVPEEENNED